MRIIFGIHPQEFQKLNDHCLELEWKESKSKNKNKYEQRKLERQNEECEHDKCWILFHDICRAQTKKFLNDRVKRLICKPPGDVEAVFDKLRETLKKQCRESWQNQTQAQFCFIVGLEVLTERFRWYCSIIYNRAEFTKQDFRGMMDEAKSWKNKIWRQHQLKTDKLKKLIHELKICAKFTLKKKACDACSK